MIDSVIAGTGNSRFLRTSISASTTWEDALTMLRAGTFPIDLAGINIDGYVTVGTPLNAETLLKESVITALDLDENATPSDAWEKLIAIVNTKADADSVVTAITYDSAEKKLYATINGTPTLVTTFNFTTPQEAADAAPVQSVAGKTGNVALSAEDVAYAEGTTYSDNTVGKALADDDTRMGTIEGSIANLDETKANIDGYYEEMTVGNAEQLVATVGIDDNAPYLFRTTGGSADVGDRKTMELVGGTVAWNQLTERSAATTFNQTYVSYDSETKIYTISYSEGSTTSGNALVFNFPERGDGHKYWTRVQVIDSSSYSAMRWYLPGTSTYVSGIASQLFSTGIIGGNSDGAKRLAINKTSSVTVAQSISFRLLCFDLTQMFGSTIAD